MEPFDVHFDGSDYRVRPEYAYELEGLVVSFRHHDGKSRMHRLADDHLNMLDVCVVWGDNANRLDLAKFDFDSGEFTCFYRTRDEAAWRAFRPDEISNNHLLSDDPGVRAQIENVEVGDQVKVRGYLVRYSNAQGFNRGTSTVRTDTGNGACETIFVERFAVTRAASSPWRLAEKLSLGGLVTFAATRRRRRRAAA